MRRSGRHELATFVTVLAVPTAIAFAFPFASVKFRASAIQPDLTAHAAFVTLTEAQEKAALASARASWQGDPGVRRLRANLAVGELPKADLKPVLDVCERMSQVRVRPTDYPAGPFVPSSAAARPSRIGAEKGEPRRPAFSREDLLKID